MKAADGVELHIASDGGLRCWLDTPHARGWLTPAPGTNRIVTPEQFARELAAAQAQGFVAADAAVLAMLRTHHPDRLPLLSWDAQQPVAPAAITPPRRLDLYAIVDSAERIRQVLAAGVRTVQLRIKTPEQPDAAWFVMLRGEIERSVAACTDAGAELFVNDHWQLAAEAGAGGVHLGQEDLLALGDAGRTQLQAAGMALGISSHSLWELCRARTLNPRYIACGPVWPTLTKAMPWKPQGLDNLAWWCRMAGVPVVAIGGILGAQELALAASCGADGVCIVRGLGDRPQDVVPALQAALEAGRRSANPPAAPGEPHPSL
jgi:hydroxymethylpyrimidine kinase/phosphomethylpyrimidine kinase/thiamine-phosphate diphosphorylase